MNYYDEIDPVGESDIEEKDCPYCGWHETNYNGYCSKDCYMADLD
jgi:endogenous inhibitor of DNA gyrase (YacG/DUF329 family)